MVEIPQTGNKIKSNRKFHYFQDFVVTIYNEIVFRL